MKAKTTWLVVALFTILFASTAFCQGWTQLPCEVLNQANAVFVGRVTSINADLTDKEADQYLVEFIVEEPFVDTIAGDKVTARVYGGTADYIGLVMNKSFVVYAERIKDKPYVNLNSYSKPLNKAAADLFNLRRQEDDSSARIFGSVRMVTKSSVYKDSRLPIPGTKINIVNKANTEAITAITDPDGNFEVVGLNPGNYSVRPFLPQPKNLIVSDYSYRLAKQSCVEANIEVRPDIHVRGIIVDTKGGPVANAQLELVPIEFQKPRFDVEEPNERTESNDSGEFSIANVPPGKYHLAVNYTNLPEKTSPYPTSFYPGTPMRAKAEVIEVTADKNIEGLRYVLGPERLAEKKMTGRVIYPDGRPVANTDVYLKEDENQVCCVLEKAVTDAKGNFTLVGFATHKYRIWTYAQHKPFTPKINYIGASPVFVLDNSTAAFQLVMKPTPKESLDAIDEIEMRDRGKIR